MLFSALAMSWARCCLCFVRIDLLTNLSYAVPVLMPDAPWHPYLAAHLSCGCRHGGLYYVACPLVVQSDGETILCVASATVHEHKVLLLAGPRSTNTRFSLLVSMAGFTCTQVTCGVDKVLILCLSCRGGRLRGTLSLPLMRQLPSRTLPYLSRPVCCGILPWNDR